MALVLPVLIDCRWWFESLLVRSGVSSATRRKATGADKKKSPGFAQASPSLEAPRLHDKKVQFLVRFLHLKRYDFWRRSWGLPCGLEGEEDRVHHCDSRVLEASVGLCTGPQPLLLRLVSCGEHACLLPI